MRVWSDTAFDRAFRHLMVNVQWQETPDFYPRYRTRYDAILRRFAQVVLARLRSLLRPGGVLLCTTPNLYRLRDIAYLIRGQQMFDYFDLPGERGYGHVLEYSAEHLAWQFQRAGFADCVVERHDFAHESLGRQDRMLAPIDAPLRRIRLHRNYLLAVARAPQTAA